MHRPVLLIACLLFFAVCLGAALPDDGACTVTLPVSVFLPNMDLIRDLNKGHFVAKNKHEVLSIRSVASDTGPRRIVFVVETGRRIPPVARRVESVFLSELIARARPEDSFAFRTALGASRELRPGTSSEVIAQAVADLEKSIPGEQKAGILDAVLEAADWLEPHQPGDALVVLAMGIEHDRSHTSFGTTKAALVSAGVRVFGMQLGTRIGGTYGVTIFSAMGSPQITPLSSFEPNEESLFSLSYGTGGFAVGEDTSGSLKTYKLTDRRIDLLKEESKQTYKAIKTYYRLTVDTPPFPFDLDVSEDVRKQVPTVMLTYPRMKNYCAPAAHD